MLGNWVLERKLGQGGFGTVYLAYRSGSQPGVKDRAALKVINSHLRDEDDYPGTVARFLDEFRVLKQLQSPFCAKVLDGDVTAENPWMATQFISGDSLAEEIRHEGPLPADLWWLLVNDLLTGLEEAHSKGIIHRDIKPQNVMRGVRGSVLIDFGIAKLAGNPKLTAKASPMTPGYASPEQLMGKELTTASDLYSLGHTLFFAATGRLAFPSENLQALIAGILSGSPDLSGLDNRRARFVSSLMSKDPSDRPSSKQALSICKDVIREDSGTSAQRDAESDGAKERPAGRNGVGNVRIYRPKKEANNSGQLRFAPQKITARITPKADSQSVQKSRWGEFEREVVNFLIRAGRSQFLLPVSNAERRDIYFQGFFDSDGRLTLEATSNKFLNIKLTENQQRKMQELGWELPSEDLPNFIKFLELDESKKPRVAKLIVESLRAAYSITTEGLSIDAT